jgi:hypothetical protein
MPLMPLDHGHWYRLEGLDTIRVYRRHPQLKSGNQLTPAQQALPVMKKLQ